MLRPSDTLEEAYARSLEEEALLRELGDEGSCPSCRRLTDKEFQFCPSCQTQLKDKCARCERLLSFSWVACPYCGTARPGATPSLEPAPVQTASQPPAQEEPLEPSGAPRAPEAARFQH
jgi:RNA polymerase subunit RPABC4/transcription elongation factor Spt4